MSARFEIVQGDGEQPWHARFIAPNGRIVWTTETYARRKSALNAIASFIDPFSDAWLDSWWYEDRGAFGDAVVFRKSSWEKTNGLRLEIRDVDERGAK